MGLSFLDCNLEGESGTSLKVWSSREYAQQREGRLWVHGVPGEGESDDYPRI